MIHELECGRHLVTVTAVEPGGGWRLRCRCGWVRRIQSERLVEILAAVHVEAA